MVVVRVRLTARSMGGLLSRRVENGNAEEKGEGEAIDDWVEVGSRGQNSGERV